MLNDVFAALVLPLVYWKGPWLFGSGRKITFTAEGQTFPQLNLAS